jgi:hypothetical protein
VAADAPAAADTAILLSIAAGFGALKPSRSFPLEVTLSNGTAAARDMSVGIDGPADGGVFSLPPQCMRTGQASVLCRIENVAAHASQKLTMQFIAPPHFDGGSVTFNAWAAGETVVQTSITAPLYRTFLVTNTANDGAGSLRQAILDLNAACTTNACAIGFHIDEPSATPWKTIRITSTLPTVTAGNYVIDGSWQTETVGDTNPDGPEIEISGGGTAGGDGLTIGAGCHGEVANLVINGFRGNGVSVINTRNPCKAKSDFEAVIADTEIHHLFIGTDPTGSLARPNGLRGVGTSFGFGNITPAVLIDHSVISGNARSGIFVLAGFVTITENRIGLKAHTEEPLPNGASGIYFGASGTWFTRAAAISSNDIAYNRQFGVAVNPRTPTSLSKNRIWGNGNPAIDYGLDGVPTPVDTGTPHTDPMPRPFITSARYDAITNKTAVRGEVSIPRSSGPYVQSTIELFASDTAGPRGTGDARTYLGSVNTIPFPPDVSTPQVFQFLITVDGNHEGDWVTATVTRAELLFPEMILMTSELSAPEQVTR